MIESLKSLQFDKVTLAAEGQVFLKNLSQDLPTGCNCRWVLSSDKERFFVFQALSQLEGFQAGEFRINGQNVLEMSFEEFLPIRLKMGFAFANRGLLQNRTLRQNLLLPLEYHKMGSEEERASWLQHLMGYFDLTKELDRRPSEVAPSAQKATLLLRAFVHRPEWVILDTPEMLLQKSHHASILQLIDDHRRHHGLAHVYFSTNDEELADCLTDRALVVRQGKMTEVPTIQRLRGAA